MTKCVAPMTGVCVRHANATHVDIAVAISDTTLTLEVADDGDGINSEAIHGNGLNNLQARARRLGGTCNVTTNQGGGTTVVWQARV